MARVKLILVGGFLGAGKTTLLARAAERLAARGLRVALVTNDQAANLVDTELLRQAGQEVKEVSGACFCCAFNKLLYVLDNLISLHHPDVILAEPVGSCTDLSATVLQPMKQLRADRFDLAPYSVLVDPERLVESLAGQGSDDVARAVGYIYRKQIEEADLIVMNKSDLLPAPRRAEVLAAVAREYPAAPVLAMSAASGAGVDAWLDRVLGGSPGGQRVVEVDYDTYAAGEAALGWLNAAVELSATEPADWAAFAREFLDSARERIRRLAGEIAHLKILLTAEGGRFQASVTSNAAAPIVRDSLSGPSRYATLVVNARVRTSPEELRVAVEEALRQAAGDSVKVNVAELSSFRPGRPMPVHRFPSAVP